MAGLYLLYQHVATGGHIGENNAVVLLWYNTITNTKSSHFINYIP